MAAVVHACTHSGQHREKEVHLSCPQLAHTQAGLIELLQMEAEANE